MKIEDVKSLGRRETRTCRSNLRLYPSQMKFINDHGLSVQKIFDKALTELGHVDPAPEDIAKIAQIIHCQQDTSRSRGRGRGRKGNVIRQRKVAKTRKTTVRRRRN